MSLGKKPKSYDCPSVDDQIVSLGAPSSYRQDDPTRSTIDKEARKEYLEKVTPLREYNQSVVKIANAYTEGKYDLAIKELKRAYVLKRIPAILVNIAMTYRKTKDYEMAIYFYKKFLAEVPADEKQRASIETAIGEVEKERTAASQPQQLAPAKPAVEAAKPAVEAVKAAAGKKAKDLPRANREPVKPKAAFFHAQIKHSTLRCHPEHVRFAG